MKHTITGHTGLICLLGSPCAHSISPMMHNAAFEALDLDYRYLAFDVNEETLPAAVDGLKAMNARGFNLTMPDKNRMVSLCDQLSPRSPAHRGCKYRRKRQRRPHRDTIPTAQAICSL